LESVPGNRHDGAVAGLRLGKLCDGVVSQIVEAKVWKPGCFPKIAPAVRQLAIGRVASK
jgi:hypothetical protein